MNCVWITGFGYREYFGQRGKVLIILLSGGEKAYQKKDIKEAIKVAKEA